LQADHAFDPRAQDLRRGICRRRLAVLQERAVEDNRPSYYKIIEKYGTPETFFYIDPPYWGCENDYGKNIFSRTDFKMLAEILKNIKGRFILSINNVPEIRELFESFNIREVQTKYSVDKSSVKPVTELLIINY
jgi:DNA adenine methylase